MAKVKEHVYNATNLNNHHLTSEHATPKHVDQTKPLTPMDNAMTAKLDQLCPRTEEHAILYHAKSIPEDK